MKEKTITALFGRKIIIDDMENVKVRDPNGGQIVSQSVDAHLLLGILMELRKLTKSKGQNT